MEQTLIVILVLGVIAIFGIIPGMIASSRGHNFWAFFFLSILISPILAVLLAFIVPAPARPARRRTGGRGRARPGASRGGRAGAGRGGRTGAPRATGRQDGRTAGRPGTGRAARGGRPAAGPRRSYARR